MIVAAGVMYTAELYRGQLNVTWRVGERCTSLVGKEARRRRMQQRIAVTKNAHVVCRARTEMRLLHGQCTNIAKSQSCFNADHSQGSPEMTAEHELCRLRQSQRRTVSEPLVSWLPAYEDGPSLHRRYRDIHQMSRSFRQPRISTAGSYTEVDAAGHRHRCYAVIESHPG